MNHWLRNRQAESSILKSFVQQLKDVTVSTDIGDYTPRTMVRNDVISLNMYFPETSDSVLDDLEAYLNGEDVSLFMLRSDEWFQQANVLHDIQIQIGDLLQYMEANRGSSIDFIAAVLLPDDLNQVWPYAEIIGFYSEERS